MFSRDFNLKLGLSCVVLGCAVSAFATNSDTDRQPLLTAAPTWEVTYLAALNANHCFPVGVDANQAPSIALKQEELVRAVMTANAKLLPTPGPDGQLLTQNEQGYNWRQGPAVTALINHFVKDKGEATLLDVGAAYGVTSLACVRQFPNVSVTALDIEQGHVSIMNQLACDASEKWRFKPLQGDFLRPGTVESEAFDVVLMVSFMNWLSPQDIKTCLRNAFYTLKPGGVVIMRNLSKKASLLTRAMTAFCGDYSLMYTPKLSWQHHFSPESIQALAGPAGFEVVLNQYCGEMNLKNAASYWWTGVDMEAMNVISVLGRPVSLLNLE